MFIAFSNTWLGNLKCLTIYHIVKIIKERVKPIYH